MTFQRMADRRPVETLVERDDGVVFAMRGAGGGAEPPHDLVHALVETELRIPDGVWGCVADGAVWGSMRHVSGRRPPHAADRSERLKRERAAAVNRAEHVADLVGRLARAAEVLPSQVAASGFPPGRLQAAAQALRDATARWAALTPGETWVVEWPVSSGTGARRRRSGGQPTAQAARAPSR
ncbi:hypothetical protein SAMN06893097_105276 [Geodermatophilus sabuli]|uniref:Uncharacterized protein n=2 Tax=Geodermatophilus sabuli TaxID=1564158 RepID=A0A285ED32_9ACTN|nr:hypothetical protein SAMN06893097_105276 [Geodermatophilus sabuli]